MIQGFNVAVGGIGFRTDIGNNCLRGKEPGINHTAQIQLADDILKGKPVDFGNDLGIGYMACMQGQQDIFLINAGQGNDGFRTFNALLLQQFFICAIAIDDNGLRQQNAQLFTAGTIDFNDLYRNAHITQLSCQIISALAAADNHGIVDTVGFQGNGFQEGTGQIALAYKGNDITLRQLERTGRDMDIALAFYHTDQHSIGNMLSEIGNGHAIQNIALRDFEFNHFHLSMSKGIDLQCGG